MHFGALSYFSTLTKQKKNPKTSSAAVPYGKETEKQCPEGKMEKKSALWLK